MKKLCMLLVMTGLLSGCSGLPYPREMGDMALLRTMGVDMAQDGLYVTVSTGPRAQGLQGEQEGALVLSTQDQSLSGATLSIQGLSDSYVYFGYVDQLLLGEEITREGIVDVLDYFAQDVELGLGAQLWAVRGATAEDAVRSGGEKGVDSRLTTLQTDGKMGASAISRTAGEVYTDLLEQGAAYFPALTPAGEEGASLVDWGYAVLQGESLVGYLEGEAARGLELLVNKPSAHVVQVQLPSGRVVVRLSKAITACSLDGDGLVLHCKVAAHLAEYDAPLTQQERQLVQKQLEEQESARVMSALEQMQSWGADCAGLGARAGLRSPRLWSAVEESWPAYFAAHQPRLSLEVELHL